MIERLSWSVQYHSESCGPWLAIAWVVTALQRVSWNLEWWVSLICWKNTEDTGSTFFFQLQANVVTLFVAGLLHLVFRLGLPFLLSHAQLAAAMFFVFFSEFKTIITLILGVGMNNELKNGNSMSIELFRSYKDATTSHLWSCSIYVALIPISEIRTSLDGGMCLWKAPSVYPPLCSMGHWLATRESRLPANNCASTQMLLLLDRKGM